MVESILNIIIILLALVLLLVSKLSKYNINLTTASCLFIVSTFNFLLSDFTWLPVIKYLLILSILYVAVKKYFKK